MFSGDPHAGRVLHFGIREHGMGAIMNGIAAHGGTRVFGGTFLTFSDYMRPSVRLAALMQLPVTYVWTHDSIGLGEDGPTHQPIEHLAALRAIPGLDVVRPADANETVAAWKAVLEHTDRPAGLCLSRQNVPVFPRGDRRLQRHQQRRTAAATSCSTPTASPTSSWSAPAPRSSSPSQARELLAADGIAARVVSMPCREWYDAQETSYRETVIPPHVKARVSVEAGIALGWREVVGDHGRIVSHRALRRVGRLRAASTASSASPPRRSPRPRATASPPRRPERSHPGTPTDHRPPEEPMTDRMKALADAGVSIWLDDLSRERIETGNLAELMETRSVVGVTTNPSIFAAALSEGERYDAQVRELAAEGADVDATVFALTTTDVRQACDILRPAFDASDGADGRVSIEVAPDAGVRHRRDRARRPRPCGPRWTGTTC